MRTINNKLLAFYEGKNYIKGKLTNMNEFNLLSLVGNQKYTIKKTKKMDYRYINRKNKNNMRSDNTLNNIIGYSAQGILNDDYGNVPASFNSPNDFHNFGVITYNSPKQNNKKKVHTNKNNWSGTLPDLAAGKIYDDNKKWGLGKYVILFEPTDPWYNNEIYKTAFMPNIQQLDDEPIMTYDNTNINHTNKYINNFHIIALSLLIVIISLVCIRIYLNNKAKK